MVEPAQARWRASRPTLPIPDHDRYYLAGLVEGEGSFYLRKDNTYPQAIFQLNMTDEDVVLSAWERSGKVGSVRPHVPGPRSVKPQWRWRIGAAAEVAWFMDQMYPLLGERRRSKIDELRTYFPDWALSA